MACGVGTHPRIPVRFSHLCSLALYAAACAPVAVHAPPAPPPRASAPPSAPAEVAAARAPEADPAEFRGESREADVDGDGLVDRVRVLPVLGAAGEQDPIRATDDAVVVAHRLPDGRFAVDDEVTRALLRAACPSTPYEAPPREGTLADEDFALRRLFWVGFCARAWGATADEAERAVRSFSGPPAQADRSPAIVDAALRAVRQAVVPITLRPFAATPLRAWRPTPSAQEPTPAPERSPASPPNRRCARVDARNRAGVRAVLRRAAAFLRAHDVPGDPPTIPFRPGSHCAASDAGIWSLAAGSSRFLDDADDPGVNVTFTLTWRPLRGDELTAAERLVADEHVSHGASPVIERIFDWDNDGTPELALRDARWQGEGPTERSLRVFTARDGSVRPYAPAQALANLVASDDADADGRPDLELRSPWRAVDHSGQFEDPHEGPTLLAHARPDGSFTLRDEIARAWVRRQCARAEHERRGTALDVIDIACARAWGQSPEEVVAAAYGVLREARQRNPGEASRDEERLGFREIASTAAFALPFEALREGDAAPPSRPAR
jgi:hypothetical protein